MSEGEAIPAVPPRKAKAKKIFFYLSAFIALVVLLEQVWYRYTYPFGWSHSCSAGLGLSFPLYEENHGGWLPHGESTPETSLSLLYKDDPVTALWTLGGKNISRETLEAAFKRDGKLYPTNCGWHYVEGLRDGDPPEIAVVWDKTIGLGHNGQRVRGMMHEIVLLDGSHQYISKQNWPAFVAKEKELLAQIIASRDSNAPPIRWSDEETLGPNQFSPK